MNDEDYAYLREEEKRAFREEDAMLDNYYDEHTIPVVEVRFRCVEKNFSCDDKEFIELFQSTVFDEKASHSRGDVAIIYVDCEDSLIKRYCKAYLDAYYYQDFAKMEKVVGPKEQHLDEWERFERFAPACWNVRKHTIIRGLNQDC